MFAGADHNMNISLNGFTDMYVDVYSLTCLADIVEASLIVRNDGELEMYSLINTTHYPAEYGFEFGGNISDSGFSYAGLCEYYDSHDRCYINVMIRPTDLQYDGAELTLLVYLPECYTTPETSRITTLHIQGEARLG